MVYFSCLPSPLLPQWPSLLPKPPFKISITVIIHSSPLIQQPKFLLNSCPITTSPGNYSFTPYSLGMTFQVMLMDQNNVSLPPSLKIPPPALIQHILSKLDKINSYLMPSLAPSPQLLFLLLLNTQLLVKHGKSWPTHTPSHLADASSKLKPN